LERQQQSVGVICDLVNCVIKGGGDSNQARKSKIEKEQKEKSKNEGNQNAIQVDKVQSYF